MAFFSCSIYLGPNFQNAKAEVEKSKSLYAEEELDKWNKWLGECYRIYRRHKPNHTLDSNLFNQVEIKVIGALWCSDTREQVSKLVKTLDLSGFPARHVSFYYLNRQKKGNEHPFVSSYDFDKIPVIVVYRNEKEIGSIIETPVKSISEDLINILAN